MEDNRHEYWEKLAREVSGNASEADKTWLNQNQEKEPTEARAQAERVWQRTALPEGTYEPDVESGWQRFRLRVQTRATEKPPVAKIRKLNFSTMYGIAASLALFIMVGYYFISKQVTPQNWIEISTAANETKTINLTDGSTVSINQNSTFSYPENFKIENRMVKLKGEAFFEVAKAEGKRFTIFAEGTKTEVIGTSFNLRAYENQPVKVQVVTGKVAFARTATDDAIFLTPGQEGVIADAELAQLVTELESHFNVKITIKNNALRSCRFTTSFKNPELKEVLDILAITGNLTITQTGTNYTISGTGCN